MKDAAEAGDAEDFESTYKRLLELIAEYNSIDTNLV